MSGSLARARCFHHDQREAAARCPECARFYCRECVTEHEGRVLCVRCLEKLHVEVEKAARRWPVALLTAQAAAAVTVLWFTFFALADGIARLPDEFHEGKLWTEPQADFDPETDPDPEGED